MPKNRSRRPAFLHLACWPPTPILRYLCLLILSSDIASASCSCSVAASKSCCAVALPLSITAAVECSAALPFSIVVAVKCLPPTAALKRHLHLIAVSSSLPLLPCYPLVVVHCRCHRTPPPQLLPLPNAAVKHYLLVIVCPHCLLIVVSLVDVVVCHRCYASTLPSSITAAIKCHQTLPLP
jgi:hypothetical protein